MLRENPIRGDHLSHERSELAGEVLAGDPETRKLMARGASSYTQVASIVYCDIRQDDLNMHTSGIMQGHFYGHTPEDLQTIPWVWWRGFAT